MSTRPIDQPMEPFRLDWSRPVSPYLPGRRTYHATNGAHHILVVLTDAQLEAAKAIAQTRRRDSDESSVERVLEDAINRSAERRRITGGQLRLYAQDLI